MRADYSPAPGTTAYRVIAHMETLPAGAEVMTSALAEAIGVPANNLTPCLEAAVNAGKLFRRQRDNHVRSPYWWSLTDRAGGQPPPKRQTVYVPDEPKTPQKGANRDASTGQSHGAEGSESPNGRGSNAAPALGAAPAFHTPEPGPQQVLKAEAARPDATDRGAPDIASPGGGPTGAGQPAAAGPAGEQPPLVGKTVTVSMTGQVAVVAECGTVILFDGALARQLMAFCAGRAA